MSNSSSLGSHIVDNQFTGPAMSQRSFFRWANNNYPEGAVTGQISNYQNITSVDSLISSGLISVPSGKSLQINLAFIDSGEIVYWAKQHILSTAPELINTSWVAEYDDSLGKMRILYEDTTEELVLVPTFDSSANYVFAYYQLTKDSETSDYVETSSSTNEPARPDDTDFTQDTISYVTVTETLKDGDSESTRDETVTNYDEVMTKDVYLGQQGNAIVTEHHRLTILKRYSVVETSTDYEEIQEYYDYQLEVSETTSYEFSDVQLFIYELGSGNATLDALETTGATLQEFFPIIPLRYYNKAIDDAAFSDDFAQFKKAYKKSVGTNIDDLLETIEDHESVDDIDHAFLTFGVELNCEYREGLRYSYEFLKSLIGYQSASATDLNNWLNSVAYSTYQANLSAWFAGQDDPSSEYFNTPQPVHVAYALPDTSNLKIKNTGAGIDIPYDIQIEWLHIEEVVETGLGKSGAVLNEFWWEVLPDETGDSLDSDFTSGVPESTTVNHVRLFWQKTDSVFVYLDIYGLTHINAVYKGKSVIISAKEGIEDDDPSGFVLPMHYPTMRKLPIVWLNELSIQNKLLMFNSYLEVKQKWWETGIFKVLSSVALIALAPYLASTLFYSLPLTVSLQSALNITWTITNTLVTASIGGVLSGVADIINPVLISIFGEKVASILVTIALSVSGMLVGGLMNGQSIASVWDTLTKSDVLLRLTNVLSTGVEGWVQLEMSNIEDEFTALREESEKELDNLSAAYSALGYSSGVSLIPFNSSRADVSTIESSQSFLNRTLLTGDDIANISFNMINEFANLTLILPKPIM